MFKTSANSIRIQTWIVSGIITSGFYGICTARLGWEGGRSPQTNRRCMARVGWRRPAQEGQGVWIEKKGGVGNKNVKKVSNNSNTMNGVASTLQAQSHPLLLLPSSPSPSFLGW